MTKQSFIQLKGDAIMEIFKLATIKVPKQISYFAVGTAKIPDF